MEGLLQDNRGCSHTGRPRKNPLTPEEQLEKYKQEKKLLNRKKIIGKIW